MTSRETTQGRHRLVEARRPALLPRSANVVAATVGAVLVLAVQGRADVPAPRPHPDAPKPAASGFQPVVPAQREGRPAQVAPTPGPVSGASIAGMHLRGSASLGALDAVAATQPPGGTAPENLFAA